MTFGPLVTTQWLAEAWNDGDLTILDASWHMPAAQRNARDEYLGAHIPGALFYDLDALSDRTTSLPHMLAPAEVFSAAIGALGIGSSDRIVVYDTLGLFSAPRAWWTLRAMGHARVAVLDGGFPKWKNEGRPTEQGEVKRAPRTFDAAVHAALVRDLAQIQSNIAGAEAQLIDARSAARFEGREPEPRAGLRGGHIPGSRNVPFSRVVAPDGTLRPPRELAAIFKAAKVDLDRPVIATCGSGVTASVLALALETIDKKAVPVYDGSWSEWGARADTQINTGPAT